MEQSTGKSEVLKKKKPGGRFYTDENRNFQRLNPRVLRNLFKFQTKFFQKRSLKRRGKKLKPCSTPVNCVNSTDWTFNCDENLPGFQAILSELENNPLHDLSEMGELFDTRAENSGEDMGPLSGDALDNAISDVILDMEEENVNEDFQVDKPEEFPEVLTPPELGSKCGLKYGSSNPLLTGITPKSPFQLAFDDSDSDDNYFGDNPDELIHLKYCDVIQYLLSLENSLALKEYTVVQNLLKTMGKAKLPLQALINFESQILDMLFKAFDSPDRDVVESAEEARDNFMAALSEADDEPAKIAYLSLKLTER